MPSRGGSVQIDVPSGHIAFSNAEPLGGAVHEFGSIKRKIPKRSFIAMPIQTKQAQIQKSVEGRFAGHLARGDVAAIFTDIGLV